MDRFHSEPGTAVNERLIAWTGGSAVVTLVLAIVIAAWLRPASTEPPAAAATAAAAIAPQLRKAEAQAAQYLQFEPNQGQAAKAVRYLSRGPKHSIEVFDDGIALSAQRSAGPAAGPTPLPARTEPARAQLRFVGASDHGHFESREPAAGHANYLTGGDSSKWIRDLPRYRQLRYADLYPGIDLVYYSRDGELEFDLVVKPGADPSRIRLHVGGADAPAIAANGDLLLDGANGALRLHRPVLYQNIDGEKKVLDAQYVLGADRSLRFALPAYDKRYPLVIDPVFKLLYSSYLTGFHDEQVGGMAVDAQSNAYVVGRTNSDDFVVSANAVQTGKSTTGLQYNVVLTKFDASGTLIYSTYLGGSGSDIATAIAVDAAGNAYLTGNTTSRDFPVTAGAQQPTFTGSLSAFLAVVSPDGSVLAHSTYYGGSGSVQATAVALDAGEAPVIAGFADSGLVTTPGAYKTTLAAGDAAFVARFSAIAAGAPRLLAASYYGVDNPQANATARGNRAFSMALDASGAPWLTGQAYTTNLPTSAAAVQSAPAAMSPSCVPGPAPLNSFAFVARLSADLASLSYASYLTGATEPAGGAACAEFGHSLAVDSGGNVYLTGATASAAFATTAGAAQATFPSAAGVASYTGFVTKLKPDGSAILWSTYLGGNGGNTFPAVIALDPANAAVWTTSVTGGGSNYPVSVGAVQATHGGGGADAGLVQFDAATGAIKYSTFLGGASADVGLALGIDAGGTAFVAGNTFSANFPVTANAFEKTYRPDFYGGADWFFSVLGNGTIGVVAPPSGSNGGDATISISGAGFQSGATCTLANASASLNATRVDVDAAGSQAHCTFAMIGLAPGSYDVVVTNPDGSVLRKRSAYGVSAGGGSNIEVDIVGRAIIRVGVPSDFLVTIRNTGSVDAYMVPLWITMSANVKYMVTSIENDPFMSLKPIADGDGDFTDAQKSDPSEARKIALILPHLPAGYSGALRVQVTDSVLDDDFSVGAYTELPWFETAKETTDALSANKAATVAFDPSCIDAPTRPSTSNCFGLWADLLARGPSQVAGDVPASILGVTQSMALVRFEQEFATTLLASVNASGSLTATKRRPTRIGAQPLAQARPLGLGLVDFGSAVLVYEATWGALVYGGGDMCTVLLSRKFPPVIGYSLKPAMKWDLSACVGGKRTLTLTYNCQPAPVVYQSDVKCPDPKNKKKKKNKKGKPQGSVDPNEKSGPDGGGGVGHPINGSVALNYRVGFENVATASLPAATVVVTDQLDPAKVDVSSLTLGPVGWGSVDVDVPPGLRSYATVKPIDATLSVRVQGSLNPVTGLLKWTFASIDPATGLAPTDPTIGFLPPDTDGIKGQGFVSFSALQKKPLPEGTVFTNQASIVFDNNAPIVTPTWTNTLDNTAPVSRIEALTGLVGTSTFDVSWSGSDAGSGAARFSVYVSDNGAPFGPWQDEVTATKATYQGTSGHSYAFYVVATDGAGNAEAAKSAAEATIAVNGTFGSASGSSDRGGGCTIGGAESRRDAGLPLLVLFAAAWLGLSRRRRHGPTCSHEAA